LRARPAVLRHMPKIESLPDMRVCVHGKRTMRTIRLHLHYSGYLGHRPRMDRYRTCKYEHIVGIDVIEALVCSRSPPGMHVRVHGRNTL
jgi:hypothetical protein